MSDKSEGAREQIVFWHRELPPLDAEVMDEHTVEADSRKVHGRFAHHDEAWQSCYRDLMEQTRHRIEQEVVRLGGHLAHVLDESIEAHADDAQGTAWLHGRFTYVLCRRQTSP